MIPSPRKESFVPPFEFQIFMSDAASPAEPHEATAYHEAGHAVMALYLGRPVHKVTIEPNTQRLGQCKINKGSFKPSQDILEGEILILLAGAAAEARFTGVYHWAAASSDLRQVRVYSLMRAGGPKQVERLERRMLDKTEHILSQPGLWSAVKVIATELMKLTTISGRAAKHHFEQCMQKADG